MSNWEKLRKSYITHFPPTQAKEEIIPMCFSEASTAAKLGIRTLFANFEGEPVWVTNKQCVWRYVSTNKDVNQSEVCGWFPYYQQVEDLDPYIGGGRFENKSIYFHKGEWRYLNHHKVHFNGSEASESGKEDPGEESKENDEDEEGDNKDPSKPESDTVKVENLLQSTETSVTSALQKLSSRPGTPA